MVKDGYIPGQVLKKPGNWRSFRFYDKCDALYQLTFLFCERFLPKYGDRTVDQMVQAARSGKQNIVEGSEDGKTSTEMELKLLNVARSSIGELREDYKDYLNAHHLPIWSEGHPRYQAMQQYTKEHNKPEDYMPLAARWNDEEYANTCLTLCFQVDVMMNRYLKKKEEEFVTEGGIKERMYRSRTGHLNKQEEQLAAAKAEAEQWRKAYEDLKQRATAAWNAQQEEIKQLKAQLAAKEK